METAMSPEEILLAREEYLFPASLHYFEKPLLLTRAKGPFVYDAVGREYLDFFGGIVVVSLGHCNEEINARIKHQMDTLQHCSTLLAAEPPAVLAKEIARITPGALKRSFFTNSGTEANEMAVLAARIHTNRSEIVALRHSYHGRSSMMLSMTGQSVWRIGAPAAAGFTFAQNAYCYRCPYGKRYPDCEVRCAEDMRETIATTTSGRIAAVIAEPVQGTGGFITPPKEYFPRVAQIAKEHGGVFIADEVQSGFGRTGTWFAIEHWGVEPDILVSAKGMGNGFPVGVTVLTQQVADSIGKMTISTFGGNPVAATAAKAVVDYIEEHDVLANVRETGAHLRQSLEALRQKYPLIGDVRGIGLMQAIELVKDPVTKEPAVEEAALLMEAGRKQQILFGKGGLLGNVCRITPPLNISRPQVDEFCRRLDCALSDVKLQAGS
jgi:4-aminobutyrate aminotransferase